MGNSKPGGWMWSDAIEMLAKAERLHNEAFGLLQTRSERPCWEPPVDVLETETAVIVFTALPGVDPDNVSATIEDGTLMIFGERVLPPELRRATIHRFELPRDILAEAEIGFADFCYSYSHPQGVVPGFSGPSLERKPSPYFLFVAAARHDLDLARSWMVGDRDTDVQCGAAAGVRTILVDNPHAGEKAGRAARRPAAPVWPKPSRSSSGAVRRDRSRLRLQARPVRRGRGDQYAALCRDRHDRCALDAFADPGGECNCLRRFRHLGLSRPLLPDLPLRGGAWQQRLAVSDPVCARLCRVERNRLRQPTPRPAAGNRHCDRCRVSAGDEFRRHAALGLCQARLASGAGEPAP
ncbi:MAG: HAD hydrolase-like protein [Aliidongia sp.]